MGPDGPILLQDHYLIEQMANFNRERIPERQPHAKGGGAFGHFEVTQDVSAYTKAAVFQPGTRTDTLIRFSTVAGERGSPDTWRDPRGFSLKFYTSEGNYDMVGNNTPVFFLRDPLKFQHFIRSQKRRADNNLRDHDMQWDFWTLSPESAHQVTWLMGDRGIPRTWRHMNGYSSHTYMWVNAAGERYWVKYHFKTDQGIEFFTQDEGDQMASADTDYHQRDLYDAIERGDYPSWTLKVQIMPFEEARNYRFNPFDLTKVWPHSDYPLHRGRPADPRPEPDRLPHRDRAGGVRAEQPGARRHAEPGQDAAGPRVLLLRRAPRPARRELQADPGELAARCRCTATARTGRCAWSTCTTRCTRRTPRVARRPTASTTGRSAGTPTATWCGRAYTPHEQDDDWGQAGTLVREVMDDAARERLVSNVVGHLLNGVSEPVLQRAFEYWSNVDKDLGGKIEAGRPRQGGREGPQGRRAGQPGPREHAGQGLTVTP